MDVAAPGDEFLFDRGRPLFDLLFQCCRIGIGPHGGTDNQEDEIHEPAGQLRHKVKLPPKHQLSGPPPCAMRACGHSNLVPPPQANTMMTWRATYRLAPCQQPGALALPKVIGLRRQSPPFGTAWCSLAGAGAGCGLV